MPGAPAGKKTVFIEQLMLAELVGCGFQGGGASKSAGEGRLGELSRHSLQWLGPCIFVQRQGK